MFNSIYPKPGVVDDLLDLVLEPSREVAGRPWVLLNMVASIDGATTVEGRSSGLGDDDDLAMFKALRAVPDVILVGAGTARAEDYGPVRLDGERVERRRALGMAELPRLAVVTGRLDLDPKARLFSRPETPPLILTGPAADPGRRRALDAVAEVVVLEDLSVEAVIGHLSPAKVVLCEGGPGLNAQLAAARLIDEVNLTLAPIMVGGVSKRIIEGVPTDPVLEMVLDRLLSGERSLFFRYLKQDGQS
ncbi:MAG TPA: dihydrofolate reductase family protein [Acidimicrobiia bacterium]|nr:dihydrofolate reductase family protein [Acidimicrobiia bacterium]